MQWDRYQRAATGQFSCAVLLSIYTELHVLYWATEMHVLYWAKASGKSRQKSDPTTHFCWLEILEGPPEKWGTILNMDIFKNPYLKTLEGPLKKYWKYLSGIFYIVGAGLAKLDILGKICRTCKILCFDSIGYIDRL